MKKRITLMWKRIGHVGVDAIILTSNEMIRYLTGFCGSESILLLGGKECRLIVDSRYIEQARHECHGVVVAEYVNKMVGAVESLLEMGCRKLGFDPEKMTVSQKRIFDKTGSFDLIELPDAVNTIRTKKDGIELQLMRKAATISSKAFIDVMEDSTIGDREDKIALRLEYAMREAGADGVAFPIIVVSGVRGALPHGRPSSKKIEKGDFVTIDFGSVYEGYCSDETCTVVFGKPRPKQKRIYQVVKNAHDEALNSVKEGIMMKDIDGAARKVVEQAGLGKYFRHGTGHGVGLAVHENPRIARDQETRVEKNMVFTIEPGVYIPGWGGVRIEDMVRVTDRGCEVLSSVNKELRCI